MRSARWHATVGDLACGITVTDTEGERIGFWRATLRWLARLLNWLTLGIGQFILLATDRKQGLQDLITKTVVVQRKRRSSKERIENKRIVEQGAMIS